MSLLLISINKGGRELTIKTEGAFVCEKEEKRRKKPLQSLNPTAGFSLGGNLAVLGAKTRVKNESNCARRLLGSVGKDVLVLRIRLFWHAVFVRQREKETGKERERREGGMT